MTNCLSIRTTRALRTMDGSISSGLSTMPSQASHGKKHVRRWGRCYGACRMTVWKMDPWIPKAGSSPIRLFRPGSATSESWRESGNAERGPQHLPDQCCWVYPRVPVPYPQKVGEPRKPTRTTSETGVVGVLGIVVFSSGWKVEGWLVD